MKKLITSLFISIILTSCSSDDNDTTPDNSELELTHYTLSFPSGNVTQYNFDSSKAIGAEKNSSEYVGYEYNSDNKMTKYIVYDTFDGSILNSYTFNYDNSGNMTSIDEFDTGLGLIVPENFTRTLVHENNSIKTTYPKDYTDNYSEEFIFNDDGLIKEYIKLDTDDTVASKLLFEYDDNKNCTVFTFTGKSFSNDLFSLTYKYNYDDNPNPVYSHYEENYLPYIFIHTRSFLFDYQIRSVIKTFGENNSVETIYPDGTNENLQYSYDYTYNSSGYPKKVITKNIATSITTVETEFYYK